MARHLHLNDNGIFSMSNGRNRTSGTVKGVAQAKNAISAKSAGRVGGSAVQPASGVHVS